MKKLFLSLIVFLPVYYAFAQDSLYKQGIKAIEQEQWFTAEALLSKALSAGEDRLQCSYELAWVYYCNKEYNKAIEVLSPFLQDKDSVPSDIYQLLGNAYDESGNSYKAVDIYTLGLKQYPKAGNLYLEMGNIKFKEGNYREALYWYEKGIEAQPLFASNYYRAAKVFFMSTEVVWGLLYGEIFMILEPESSRSKEFSKELYNAYTESVTLKNNRVITNFNNNIIVYSDSFERKNLFPPTFDSLMTLACKGQRSVTIASLNTIRKNFLSLLYSKAKDFDNPLFAYEQSLISNGLFEAYNYHIFAYGNTKESSAWINSHKAQWNKLIKYLKDKPIPIDENTFFSRYNME